ncbi:glycosyltransferase family 2 protein [Dermacoccaceae bacterium W4C1]
MAQLSIIVTTYNIEAYIRTCLESVAAQTLSDIEVLVVDDGSSDSTPQIIREFAAEDPRFVPVLLETNSPGGVATAANVGLAQASSPWIGFVDGDDYVEPEMFEKLLSAAESSGSDLSMCKYEEVDDAGQKKDPADARRWDELSDAVYQLDPETRRQFLRFIAVPWRKLYRAALLDEYQIRFPEGDFFYEDNPFHWFNLLSANAIAVVPEVLCYHRIGRAGQTMATADSRLFKIFLHHDTIVEWLEAHDQLEEYGPTLVGWVISQAEWISKRTPVELRQEFFDIVSPILARYPMGVIAQALREGNKGAYAERLSTALAKKNYRLYVRVLNGRPNTESPVLTGLYHLRYSGVRQTASITRRYIGNRMDNGSNHRLARLLPGDAGASSAVSGKDVMFGLIVLQQRLASMERQITELRSEVAEANRRAAEAERSAPREQ